MAAFTSRKWNRFTAAFIAISLLVAACAGETTEKKAVGDQMAPPDQQVLRIRLSGEPRTIDPHVSSFAAESTISKSLFSGLFTFDKDLNVVADVASELPTTDNGGISRDGTVYTVKMRKDAKWSDGKALTAQDFVYSFQRAVDPKTAGPYVANFYQVKGVQAYNAAFGTKASPKTPSDAEVATLKSAMGIRAKDDYTLEYTLAQPQTSFLSIMALWPAFPVRQDIIEKHGNSWTEAANHIGNGAFVLKEWSHGSRLVMEPNPNWHRDAAKLSRLVINIMEDEGAAYAAYLNNELDIVGVPAANRREVATAGSPLNKELFYGPSGRTFALIMNHKVAPFDNLKVRQALGLAFDRKAYVDVVLQGVGKATTTWIASGQPGYDADAGKQYEFNPTKAKQLLAEAGYPEGRGLAKVTFLGRDPDRAAVAPFVIDNFKKHLGIDVDFEFVESATFGARYTGNTHQATIISWHFDYPWPDNWLPGLLGCNQGNNHTGYCSAKFDDLTKKAAAESDLRKQISTYQEAQKVALDEAALMPLYEPMTFVLVKPRLKGLTITALDSTTGDYSFASAWIAAAN